MSTAITNSNIQTAVDAWISDSASATTTYGAINTWDTSAVTDMSNLFDGKTTFNDDISNWDTSQVTTMYQMFQGATAFNQNIGGWNVSQTTDMRYMFSGATNFNQDIGGWNVSNVTTMYHMFHSASAFNQDIGQWNVSKVTNMYQMFYGAVAFNQEIRTWKSTINSHGSGVTLTDMFNGATAFNANTTWNTATGYTNTTPLLTFWTSYGIPVSNVCFTAGTKVSVDQGVIPIELIDPEIHTICGMKIVCVTKTITSESHLVKIEKDAFDETVPSADIITSCNHGFIIGGELKKAQWFVDNKISEKVYNIPYDGEILYNVLMETHHYMIVENMFVETLYPECGIANLYRHLNTLTHEERVACIQEYTENVNKIGLFDQYKTDEKITL